MSDLEVILMHVLVVDDEPLARKRIIKMLESEGSFIVVGEAGSGEQACKSVELLDPELVLMDVRMPGMDGIEAAKRISQLPEPPAMVFCTAYDEYALQAFEAFAAGYLVKPVEQAKLHEVLSKILQLNKAQRAVLDAKTKDAAHEINKRSHISAKTHSGIELIAVDSILCFVADQKYVSVIHKDGEVLVDDTLKDLEIEFSGEFIRVHRNALVAVKQIAGIEKSDASHHEVKFKESNYRAVISRRHLAKVREVITQL